MRFDLESTSPAVTDVNDAGVFSRPLYYEPTARRQSLQMHA